MGMVKMVMDEMEKTVEIAEIKVHITPWNACGPHAWLRSSGRTPTRVGGIFRELN